MLSIVKQNSDKTPALSAILLAFRLSLPEAKGDILARWVKRYPEYKDDLIKSWLEWYDLRNFPDPMIEPDTPMRSKTTDYLIKQLASAPKAQIGVFTRESPQCNAFPDELSDLIRVVRRKEQAIALSRPSIHLVDRYKPEEIERVRTQTLEDCNWGLHKTEVSVILQRRYKNGINVLPPSQIDEALFILQRGRLTLDCPGLRGPIKLETNEDRFSVLWLSAFSDSIGRRGLPKRTIITEGDAIGLAVFYSRRGIEIDNNEEGTNEVELPVMEWTGRARLVRDPRVASIPRKLKELERFIQRHQKSSNKDEKHRHGVEEGQITYADFPGWSPMKKDVLRVRVAKFAARESNADRIWLDHHKGREMFLPLHGNLTALYAEAIGDDYERESSRRFRDIVDQRSMSQRVSSNTGVDELMPEILLLNSSYFHGFYGNDTPAYVLHVRILAEALNRGKQISISDKFLPVKQKIG